jgi:segregation and condensation protein B
MRLTQIIEALLFASDAPLTAADLARIDDRLDEDTVSAVVDELRLEYDQSERSFQVYDVGGGYQLLTRPEFAAVLERYDTVPQSTRLSTPALEVLAIIAYRQPLGRIEIEEIRGVQSAAVLRTLQDRALVEPVGRAEGLGRPLLYGTTAKFLEHFGFRSLEDLPRPDELPVILRSRPIGEAEPSADETDSPTDAADSSPTDGAEAGAANAGVADPTAVAEAGAGEGTEATAADSDAAEGTAHGGDEATDGDAATETAADATTTATAAAAIGTGDGVETPTDDGNMANADVEDMEGEPDAPVEENEATTRASSPSTDTNDGAAETANGEEAAISAREG